MYLSTEVKKDIFKKFGGAEANTGAAESQIALFSHRISHMTEHLKVNRKDFNTQRALLKLVGKRRRLLDHLKSIEIARYRSIIKDLDLRR
jgi:small subunit ribosomal protein S15